MSIQSLLCRHSWYWSERRQAERCHRCGKLRSDTTEAMPVLGPASAAGVEPAPTAARARTLSERLERLASGHKLSSDEMLTTVIELIEDGHVANPQLDSAAAAHHVARLTAARAGHV